MMSQRHKGAKTQRKNYINNSRDEACYVLWLKLIEPKKIILWMMVISVAIISCSNKSFSEVMFTTISGKQFTLDSLRGKWVFINYWASWCEPCHQEIPQLNAFAERYYRQAIVLGVNYELLDPPQLRDRIVKMKIKFLNVQNDPAAALGITVPGLPTTFVINPKGKLVKTLFGPQTVATLSAAISTLP